MGKEKLEEILTGRRWYGNYVHVNKCHLMEFPPAIFQH